MDLMRSWVHIEEERGERSAYCRIMNVRALVIFYGSFQSKVLYGNYFMCRLLWKWHFENLDVFEKSIFCVWLTWGRMTLALYLIMLRITLLVYGRRRLAQ